MKRIEKQQLRGILQKIYPIKKLAKDHILKEHCQPVNIQYSRDSNILEVHNTNGLNIVATYSTKIDLFCDDFALYTDHNNLASLYKMLLQIGTISITPTADGLTVTDQSNNVVHVQHYPEGFSNQKSRFYSVNDYANTHKIRVGHLTDLFNNAVSKKHRKRLDIALQFDTVKNTVTAGLIDEIDHVIHNVGSAPTLDTGTPKKAVYAFTAGIIKQLLDMVKTSEYMTFHTPPENKEFQHLITTDFNGQSITIATHQIRGNRWLNNPTQKRIRHEATPADIKKAIESIDFLSPDDSGDIDFKLSADSFDFMDNDLNALDGIFDNNFDELNNIFDNESE